MNKKLTTIGKLSNIDLKRWFGISKTKKEVAIAVYKDIISAIINFTDEHPHYIKCPAPEHIEIDGEIFFWNEIKHEMENTFKSHKRSESDYRTLDEET